MKVSLYSHRGTVYVPTLVRVEAGFYLEIEPVDVVALNQRQKLVAVLRNAMQRELPVVPTPTRDDFPKPVILKYAKVRSLRQFEREAKRWRISAIDQRYTLTPYRLRPDSGWEEDTEKEILLPNGTTLDAMLEELVERLQREYKARS